MKTKPWWTEATWLLLQAVDELHLEPHKWFIGRCWRNLFLISLSLYKGSVSERKTQGQSRHILVLLFVLIKEYTKFVYCTPHGGMKRRSSFNMKR